MDRGRMKEEIYSTAEKRYTMGTGIKWERILQFTSEVSAQCQLI